MIMERHHFEGERNISEISLSRMPLLHGSGYTEAPLDAATDGIFVGINESANSTRDSSEGVNVELSMSVAEAITFSMLMSVCICTTIVGNILVVLSVFTYRPLRSVQNFFIVSLAVADLAVAILVMPFNVANFVIGHWVFGPVFCNMWLTFDILTCTASILNLCAIALDRYYAIHDPIRYAQKRTMRRVLVTIAIVWILSALISVPPLIGWNNSAGNSLYNDVTHVCELTNEKGFVLYSASGSFYIPLIIMSFVYVNIFRATRKRLRARAKAAAAAGKGKSNVKNGKDKIPKLSPNAECGSHSSDNSDNNSPAACVSCAITNSSPSAHKKGITKSKCSTISAKVNGSQTQHTMLDASQQTEPHSSLIQPVSDQHLEKERLNAKKPPSPKKKNVETGTKMSQVRQFMEEKQRISLSKERRAARTMAIIMGVFVLCWLPFFLMYVIFPFCESCATGTDHRVINFIVWLGYINSTLNPIIYTIFNIDFRRAFKLLLQGKCRA